MEHPVTKPGLLVMIEPGNYLADVSPRQVSAMYLVKYPTLGVVLENVSKKTGVNRVQIQDESLSTIYASNDVLIDVETGERV